MIHRLRISHCEIQVFFVSHYEIRFHHYTWFCEHFLLLSAHKMRIVPAHICKPLNSAKPCSCRSAFSDAVSCGAKKPPGIRPAAFTYALLVI